MKRLMGSCLLLGSLFLSSCAAEKKEPPKLQPEDLGPSEPKAEAAFEEAIQKTKLPRPELSAIKSAVLTEALKTPESLWAFLIAPDSPYTERRAAALQGRDVFPIEWLPRLMASIGELRRESQLHNWGLKRNPLESVALEWRHGLVSGMSAGERKRTVLGHSWELPLQTSDFPLTWEEESRAPWPWQVHQALQDLLVFAKPNPLTAKRWLDAAIQMPCTTDEEASLFVEACDWSAHFKTIPAMARLRAIALNPRFPNAAERVGTNPGDAAYLWDDPRSASLAQVLTVDILERSPHKAARERAAYGLLRFRERLSAKGYLRMPPPATAILVASRMALDPANGGEWKRLYVYAFSVSEALDTPPIAVDRRMDPNSRKVSETLEEFRTWFSANRGALEEAADRESPELTAMREELERVK